jgi:hypothetical protein
MGSHDSRTPELDIDACADPQREPSGEVDLNPVEQLPEGRLPTIPRDVGMDIPQMRSILLWSGQ